MTSATALLVWSPYWFSLHSVGGYGPIAGNHAKYVVGFAGWLSSAARQVAGFSVLDHGFTAAGIFAAFVLAAFAGSAGNKSDPGAPRAKFSAGPIFAAALIACASLITAPLLGLAALSAFGLSVIGCRLYASQQSQAPALPMVVGGALLIVWWVGLFVATPCYWPYPRLLLPWLYSAWLVIGVLVDQLCGVWQNGARSGDLRGESGGQESLRSAEPAPHRFWPSQWSAAAVGVVLATLPLASFCRPTAAASKSAAGDRLGVWRAARQMHTKLEKQAPRGASSAVAGDDVSRVVYVLGEPPLLFQLAAAGEALVRPVEQIPTTSALYAGQSIPTFLAVGPHATRDRAYQAAWPGQANHWRLVGEYAYEPSALVWLDLHNPLASGDHHPLASGDDSAGAGHTFRLYEFLPAQSSAAADEPDGPEKMKN
ncbi:MAG: hypothetical protein IT424_08685 [Pirellulales bacterium]|nr:hypothetical protein [Pirellulales bacterium]